MKKLFIAGIVTVSVLSASCSGGWNCKSSYVKNDVAKKKEMQKEA